jgi:hypothetical protein
MTVPVEEAPANFVPAAAVIRRGLALLGMTGRKGRVGGCTVSVKFLGSTWGLHLIRAGLSSEEGRGIPSVEVKFVDIGKNTGGEGGDLVRY